MNKKIEEMNLGELKILHYDVLRLAEQCQMQLRVINEQITKKENEQTNMPKMEEKPGLECQPEKSDSKKTDK